MKVYIDFDHTLYNTNKLIDDMISCIANYLIEFGNFENYSINFNKMFPNVSVIPIKQDSNIIRKVLIDNFKRPKETTLKIKYNIYELAKVFTKMFECDYNCIIKRIDSIIEEGKKYLYDDSIEFLKNLKCHGFEIYILSHDATDLQFQNKKIKCSGIFHEDLINAMILTKKSKASLTEESLKDCNITYIDCPSNKHIDIKKIDYENGFFIDDRPKDLINLANRAYEKNKEYKTIKVFRIRRERATYSNESINLPYFGKIKDFENLREVFEFILEEICGIEKK